MYLKVTNALAYCGMSAKKFYKIDPCPPAILFFFFKKVFKKKFIAIAQTIKPFTAVKILLCGKLACLSLKTFSILF